MTRVAVKHYSVSKMIVEFFSGSEIAGVLSAFQFFAFVARSFELRIVVWIATSLLSSITLSMRIDSSSDCMDFVAVVRIRPPRKPPDKISLSHSRISCSLIDC